MKNAENVKIYLQTAIKHGLYSNEVNLKYKLEILFQGIDFEGKTVLDIGGGAGLFSFYAAAMGANKVVCLEPEASGSTANVNKIFNELKNELKYDNVDLVPKVFQEFETEKEYFDIVLLHDSINHLNEEACIDLLNNNKSRETYKDIFSKLYSMSKINAKLIVCDCSRFNFFDTMKIKNPIAPSIEWHKHQKPGAWIKLLKEVGYSDPILKWSSFNRLRNIGRIFLANKLMSYFLTSHFCLTMTKNK